MPSWLHKDWVDGRYGVPDAMCQARKAKELLQRYPEEYKVKMECFNKAEVEEFRPIFEKTLGPELMKRVFFTWLEFSKGAGENARNTTTGRGLSPFQERAVQNNLHC